MARRRLEVRSLKEGLGRQRRICIGKDVLLARGVKDGAVLADESRWELQVAVHRGTGD